MSRWWRKGLGSPAWPEMETAELLTKTETLEGMSCGAPAELGRPSEALQGVLLGQESVWVQGLRMPSQK